MLTRQSSSSNIHIMIGENPFFFFGCLFVCLVACECFLLLLTYKGRKGPIVSIINADVNQGITLQEKKINI